MSNKVKEDVCKLVDKELSAANEKFPIFASNHEAYAVLLEEAEEAGEEMSNLYSIVDKIWECTKENAPIPNMRKAYEYAYECAVNAAVEAIQCAAMARKAIMSATELVLKELDAGIEGGKQDE